MSLLPWISVRRRTDVGGASGSDGGSGGGGGELLECLLDWLLPGHRVTSIKVKSLESSKILNTETLLCSWLASGSDLDSVLIAVTLK